MINLYTVIKRKNDVLSSDINGNAVMMSIENGAYYGMNTTASDIWNMLREPISVEEIVSLLRTQYEIEPESCEHATLAFLTKLEEANLIETAL